MQEQSKEMITSVIAENIKSIKSKEPKIFLAHHPDFLVANQEKHKSEIKFLLSRLRVQYDELLPYVKKIKSYTKDITEKTHVCAIYLLLSSIFDSWSSFFILAETGRSAAAGTLIRVIKEGLMQVELFATELKDKNRTNLDKWFSGNIIQHSTGRKKVSEFYSADLSVAETDFAEISTHIYQIESQVSHNAYASILELVSPFTEDYDFDGFSGYFRTIAWLRYAIGSIEATNITLKFVYQTVIQDSNTYESLTKILNEFNPVYKN